MKFIGKCLRSDLPFIQRNTMSLWQLIIHSDSSLVLQMQVIQASPSAIIQQLSEAQESFEYLILSIFKLFRNPMTSLDYRPMPFSQFQSFFKIAQENLNSPRCVKLLHELLSLCLIPETIYCIDAID